MPTASWKSSRSRSRGVADPLATDPVDIAERLSVIGEELADLALDRLRVAADTVRAGGEPDPALTAEEKRITRARRAVEKAVGLLDGPILLRGFDEGP
jgi:hypothetical protein